MAAICISTVIQISNKISFRLVRFWKLLHGIFLVSKVLLQTRHVSLLLPVMHINGGINRFQTPTSWSLMMRPNHFVSIFSMSHVLSHRFRFLPVEFYVSRLLPMSLNRTCVDIKDIQRLLIPIILGR